MGDAENLKSYAATGCERAFRRLVEKHAKLVYSAALRRTLGNHALAEEVSQNVFTILARKARRPGRIESSALAPWLHRTAVLESANLRRKEQRRRAGLERLANESMNSSQSTHLPQLPQPALDELDAAIDTLSDADRTVLMLHYYEGKSYREVAAETGKSEAASRKQASRAVEKLGRVLNRRGVAISATALAAGLGARIAEAAPAGIAKSLATGALGGAAKVGPLTLFHNTLHTMTYAKTKTAVAVALMAAIPITAQWRQNSRLNDRLAALEAAATNGSSGDKMAVASGPAKLVTRQSSVGRNARIAADSAVGAGSGSVFNDWRGALLDPDPVSRAQRLAGLLAALTADDAPQVMRSFHEARAQGGDFDQEMRLFMRAWGGLDGEGALAAAMDDANGTRSEQTGLAQSVLGGWAAADPAAAREWVDAREQGGLTEQLALGLIDGWSMVDFDAAAAYAESRPRSTQRDRFIELLLERSLRAGGLPAAQAWFAGIADDEHNKIYKTRAFSNVVRAMLYRDPSAAAAWIAQNADQPFVDRGAVRSTVDSLALQSPREAMQWVDSLDGLAEEARGEAYSRAIQRWADNDRDGAGDWLDANKQRPDYDQLALRYAMQISRDDSASALQWIDTISDEALREESVAMMQSRAREHGAPRDLYRVRSADGADSSLSFSFDSTASIHPAGAVQSGLDLSAGAGVATVNFADVQADTVAAVLQETPQAGSILRLSTTSPPPATRNHPAITGATRCIQCHRQ